MKPYIFIFCLASLFLGGCASTQPKQGLLVDEGQDLTKEKSNLYFSIGQSYEENGRLESAIENYQESIVIDSTNPKAHFYLGKLLLKKRFIKEGLVKVERAITLDDNYTEAKNFLAYFYFAKFRNLNRAKKLINESAKDLVYKNQEETWALKLKIDYKIYGRKALVMTVPKVLALKPKVCTHRLEIASTLYKMSVYGKALESARSAYNLCSKQSDRNRASLIKGLVFIKKNNPLVAEKILNEITPQSESFKKLLNRAQTVVRKKINTGI